MLPSSTLISIFWHPLQPALFFGAPRKHHVRTCVLVAAYISHIVDEMQMGTMTRIEPGLMCRLQVTYSVWLRPMSASAAGHTDMLTEPQKLP
jgi:hypothetical protein